MPFAAARIGLEMVTLREVIQAEKNSICRCLFVESKTVVNLFTKTYLNELIYKIAVSNVVTRDSGWQRGTDGEFGTDTYTLLYLQ